MQSNSIHFTKMHGLGNDFVVIDAINQALDMGLLPTQLMADRHFGIGCDQLLIIQTSAVADFFCRILNADGSEAEQCGNGLRCVARYVHEHKLHSQSHFTIETIAGVFPVEIKDYDHISVTLAASGVVSSELSIPLPAIDLVVNGSSLSIGNPHFILQVPDIKTTPIAQIGSALAVHSAFPKGVNVGFVQVMKPDYILLRTYERGAGETNACGSNACAAVAAGILDGTLANSVIVEFKFGQLLIEWEGSSKPVRMTGPAAIIFSGEW
jgi:diaminopimelate epimerase